VPQATFTVTDGTDSVDGNLELVINPVNDAPVISDVTQDGAEDTQIKGNVLTDGADGPAFDIEGDSLEVSGFKVNGQAYGPGDTAELDGVGTLTIGADGKYTFTPVENYDGPVPQATFTVTDGTDSVDGNLELVINPVNDAPVVSDITNGGDEDTQITGNVLTDREDFDIEGDSLNVTSFEVAGKPYAAGEPANIDGVGKLTIGSDGEYSFTPVKNYNGPVPTVTFTVSDGTGSKNGTATATLDLKVEPVNDAPTITLNSGNPENANDQIDEAVLEHGTQAGVGSTTAQGTITLKDVDGQSDIDHLTIGAKVIDMADLMTAASKPISINDDHGTLVIDAYDNVHGVAHYTYTLTSPLDSGTEDVVVGGVNFTVKVYDQSGAEASANLQIDVKDDAPVLNVSNVSPRQSGDDQDAEGSDDAQDSRYDDEDKGKQDNKDNHKDAQDSRYDDEQDDNHDEGEQSHTFTPVTAAGTLVTMGADGGSVDWTAQQAPAGLTSNGEEVQYKVTGNVLTASTGDDPSDVVFTLTADSQGNYEFKQLAKLDISSDTDGEDDSSSKHLVFGFRATDSDGDHVSSQVTVTLYRSDNEDVDAPRTEGHAMLGHEGSDTFQWSLGDHDHETVKNFDFKHEGGKGGDVLDLRDLLVGEHGGKGGEHDNLDNYLKFEVEGGKLELQVKHDGGIHDAGSHADKTIVLEGYHSKAELAHDIGCSSTSDMDLLKKLVETGHLKTDS
jgi:hypothetical protein